MSCMSVVQRGFSGMKIRCLTRKVSPSPDNHQVVSIPIRVSYSDRSRHGILGFFALLIIIYNSS